MTEKDHKSSQGKILIVTEEGAVRKYVYQQDGEKYIFTPIHVPETHKEDMPLLDALFHKKQDRDPIERLLIPAIPQLLGNTDYFSTDDEIQWTRNELARIYAEKTSKSKGEEIHFYL